MPFRFGGGVGGAASAVITGFNATTKVVTVAVTDNAGANAADGTSVSIYVDGSGSAYATGTTTSGVASITLTGLDTNLGHTITPRATVANTVTGGTLTYAPSFGMASFTGTQSIKKATGGHNQASDLASATLSCSGGSVTGVASSTPGANYEPLVWQTVTSTGGGVRGQVQAKTDGTIDWTTASFSGTGHDGVALSPGSGLGATATAIITRKCTSFIMAARLRQRTGAVNGEYLFNGFGNILQQQLLTGFKIRTDLLAGTLQVRSTSTANLSTADLQDHIAAFDLKRAYNASPNPGQQIYLNDINVAPTPTNYSPVVDGTSAGLIDMGNSLISFAIGSVFAQNAGFLHADVEYVYIAWGLPAIDNVTGQLPDFSSQTVRNRFLPGNINMTNGTGVTGRQPQIFLTGSNIPTGVNLGTGGNLSTIVGTF